MRTLFVVFGDAGHLNPMIAVAQRVQESGAAIAFFCPVDIAGQLQRAGLPVPSYGAGTPASPRAVDSVSFGRRLRDRRWAERFLAMMLLDRVKEQLPAIRDAIRDFNPDVVCVDSMLYAGVAAATLERRPWAGISTNLISVVPPDWRFEYHDIFEALSPSRAALFEELGIRATFRCSDVISPHLNIAFTVDELAPRGGHYACLVGAAIPLRARGDEQEFPWEELPTDRPLVYVAFGSQINHALEIVLELATSYCERAHFVVAMKDVLPSLACRVPPNVTAVAYAPQLALLRRADMMINHGGANSVMEALHAGKPQLVLPLVNDQFIQARFVAESGAGAFERPEGVTATRCRLALDAILAEGSSYRVAAERLGVAYREHDGAAEAAALVRRLAEEKRPLRP